jgi:hypothetical protein
MQFANGQSATTDDKCGRCKWIRRATLPAVSGQTNVYLVRAAAREFSDPFNPNVFGPATVNYNLLMFAPYPYPTMNGSVPGIVVFSHFIPTAHGTRSSIPAAISAQTPEPPAANLEPGRMTARQDEQRPKRFARLHQTRVKGFTSRGKPA